MEDATLGGYLSKHARPPAFEGPDGQAYSASVFVDDDPLDDGSYGAALVFVRWSVAGDTPVGHVETRFVALGATPDLAEAAVLGMSLHELKALLDEAVLTAEKRPSW